ncbi:site-2 protease family protein [Clostridium sp.]|uniref:site-2 protease family protein n=1 Tax=Clostridium sp. TaxID=1506 RepID=UPI00260CAEB5|nr:site-2 protease family protein [Clostridium sp.]
MKKETKKILAEIILIIIASNYNSKLIFALIWVSLHEVAHIIVAKKFGCKFMKFEFKIFGTKAELEDIDILKDNKKIMVYLSGAIFNILIGIILYFINIKFNLGFLKESININFGLAIFNLLPAYPLDGSRVLEILLSKKMLYKKAQRIISIISYIIGSLFITISIYIYIKYNMINISMILGAIIIIYITRVEVKTSMYIAMGNVVRKRTHLIKNKYIENKTLSIYYKEGLVKVLALVDRNKFNSFYILNDDMKLIYILNEDELIDSLKIYGNITLEEYVNIKKCE